MKTPFHLLSVLTAVVVVAVQCGPSQRVTSSWRNPDFRPVKTYKKVFIAALTNRQRARVTIEDELAATAYSRGMQVVKSHEVFQPTFTKETTPGKDEMMAKVKELGCDLIFTTTLVERRSEVRYVPGMAYAPFPGYGYRFRGYYNYWYPFMYDPGYYTTDKLYSMEGSLFDVETETMIWSVQTESYNPESLERFSKGIAQVMMERAVQDLRMR
jgi:hypothetical protein